MKTRKIFQLLIFNFIFLSLILSFGINARAEIYIAPEYQLDSTRSRPNWFTYTAGPGEYIEDKVIISNSENQSSTIEIAGKKTAITEDGKLTVDTSSLSEWLQVDSDEISVQSQASTKVGFGIQLPEDIESGEYSLAITAKEKTNKEGTLNIVKEKGARVYLTVPGDLQIEADFGDLEAITPESLNLEEEQFKRPYIGKDNIVLKLPIENIGNMFTKFSGNVKVYAENGQVFEERFLKELIPDSGLIEHYFVIQAPYLAGSTKIEMFYQLDPLVYEGSDVEYQNRYGVLETSFKLSDIQVNTFDSKFTAYSNQPFQSTDKTKQATTKILAFITPLSYIIPVLTLTISLLIWYFAYYRKETKK